MKVERAVIPEVLLIYPDVFNDERGYFFESFNSSKYKESIGNVEFVQDNISSSVKNTIRGLHYQAGSFAQGKLCQVLKGKVLDIAVDVRFGSPTFGKHVQAVLSEENHLQIWIPPGFAHGFSVLSEFAVFSYKCTALYSKEDERSIIYNDSELNINWKVKNPLISEKDKHAPNFSEIRKDFIYE